jgi:hypothetical protein
MHMTRRCNGSAEFQRRQLRGTQGCRKCQHEAMGAYDDVAAHHASQRTLLTTKVVTLPVWWDFQLPPQISNFASTMAPTRGRIRACDGGRLRTDQGCGDSENKQLCSPIMAGFVSPRRSAGSFSVLGRVQIRFSVSDGPRSAEQHKKAAPRPGHGRFTPHLRIEAGQPAKSLCGSRNAAAAIRPRPTGRTWQ